MTSDRTGSSRRWLRVLGTVACALAALLLAAGGAAVVVLRASLPRLEGKVRLASLRAPVTVERDELGVPTLRGASREDVAAATGFVHAQERFFQMDLTRRQAAGELSELLGRATLPLDREARRHLFRERARAALASYTPRELRVLRAYTAGVNAGLADLGARPPEYLLLRCSPQPWREEDSVLVLFSLFLALQESDGAGDIRRGILHDTLPTPLADFLDPPGTSWDAPLDGETAPEPPLPGPEVVDLRRGPTAPARSEITMPSAEAPTGVGSNAWALAGSRTADGRALLANDMHLRLGVPNTWFRAVLEWSEQTSTHRLVGVTLPGNPILVAGSNGTVAWGFTASYADTADVIQLDPVPGSPPGHYLTPSGPAVIERRTETIAVRGGEPERLDLELTVWGPLVDQAPLSQRTALRWVAHDSGQLGLLAWETASSVTEILDIGAASGAPTVNLVAADRHGHIGWTVAGPLPRRVGHDGSMPVSCSDGSRRWDGLLASQDHPKVVDPPGGQLWSANNRMLSGAAQARLGSRGYDNGARAGQIRDDLTALASPTERDMLAVQLDDRAVFLSRWRDLLLATATPTTVAGHPERQEARRIVATQWNGHASTSSVAYRIVRTFRSHTATRALGDLVGPCRAVVRGFAPTRFSQHEGPLWRLVTERPLHLLHPRYPSWDALLLQALDAAIAELREVGPTLADRTWGEANMARVRHPLSLGVPQLGPLLDMPAQALPGDSRMPRAQGPDFGASERLVVAPGHEESGIFHMPCGQSGHPLSPYYRAGHEAWVRGEATPLLPGPTRHTLLLGP